MARLQPLMNLEVMVGYKPSWRWTAEDKQAVMATAEPLEAPCISRTHAIDPTNQE